MEIFVSVIEDSITITNNSERIRQCFVVRIDSRRIYQYRPDLIRFCNRSWGYSDRIRFLVRSRDYNLRIWYATGSGQSLKTIFFKANNISAATINLFKESMYVRRTSSPKIKYSMPKLLVQYSLLCKSYHRDPTSFQSSGFGFRFHNTAWQSGKEISLSSPNLFRLRINQCFGSGSGFNQVSGSRISKFWNFYSKKYTIFFQL